MGHRVNLVLKPRRVWHRVPVSILANTVEADLSPLDREIREALAEVLDDFSSRPGWVDRDETIR